MIRKEFQLVLWSWIIVPVWYQICVTGKGVMNVNSTPTELRRKDNVCVRVCMCVHDVCNMYAFMQIYTIGHTCAYSTHCVRT